METTRMIKVASPVTVPSIAPAITLALALILALLIPAPVHPCTSFADYSAEPIYGLNFDSQDHDLRFMFYEGYGFDVLAFEFFQDDQWNRMAHYNTKGLHNAGLLLYPARTTVPKGPATDKEITEIGVWMYELQTIDAFRERIEKTRFYEGPVRGHEAVYGPEYGLYCEAGPDANYVQRSEPKGFLVLTNFEMRKFHGQPPEKYYGVGDSRYRAALSSLKVGRDAGIMNAQSAMGILQNAASDAGDFKTRCSMIFQPNDLTLTVAYDRNFDKRFVISLKDKTVARAWPGADPAPVKIGKKGVSKADLLTWSNADPADDWKGSPDYPAARTLPLTVLLAVIVLAALYRLRRRRLNRTR